MPVFYRFRCSCGREWEAIKETAKCPGCGAAQKWFGMVQRSGDPEPQRKSFLGIKMEVESPAAYQEWFNSPETQAKLKSGEYEIPSKSSDIAHHRESGRMR